MATTTTVKPEKLYLDIVALEDAWVLVRTDTSPQKKAVLKKGADPAIVEKQLYSWGMQSLGAGAAYLLDRCGTPLRRRQGGARAFVGRTRVLHRSVDICGLTSCEGLGEAGRKSLNGLE